MAKLKSLGVIMKEIIGDVDTDDLFSDEELEKIAIIKSRKKLDAESNTRKIVERF